MIKQIIIFTVAIFWSFAAAANPCVDRGYELEGTADIRDLPIGHEDEDCEECKDEGLYYWKCNEKTPEKKDDKSSVNCMDYLRAGDAAGFAECTGLPGKWEKRGNQLIRVE